MSSTEFKTERLRAFYSNVLLPAAAAGRARGAQALPPNEASLQTYYIKRDPSLPYSWEHHDGWEREELLALWRDTPELREVVDQFLALADELRRQEQVGTEVSPFIYAMF